MRKLFASVGTSLGFYSQLARKLTQLSLLTAGIAVSVAVAQTPVEITHGIDWLQSQVSSDGTILGESNSQASPIQTRAEVVNTLVGLVGIPAVPSGLQSMLSMDAGELSEHLARKALSLGRLGADSSALLAELATRQNFREEQ